MSTTPSVNIVRELQQSASESREETTETKHQFHGENAGGGSGRTRQRQSMRKSARDAVNEAGSLNPSDEEETVLSTLLIDADGLSRPGIGTRARLEDSSEQGLERLNKIHGAVRTILECIGEDPNRLGILNTPERYAKAMMFLTQGYGQNIWDIVNNAIFHEDHNEIVIVKDIQIFSMCEHHMLPFMGKMHIGYVPYHSVIGISKLSRIAEMFGRRLQIQERLTKEVANAIMEVLKPQGVGVVMESSHLCMAIRGAEKSMAVTITSCVLGCFETNEKTRNEFLSLVSVRK